MRPIHAITAALLLLTGTGVTVLAQETEGPAPDLVPTDLTHDPADPVEGDNVTFTATIANEGDADAESFNVSFLVDGEQVGENKTVDALRFGDSTHVTSDNWTSTAGDHDVSVLADAHDDVDETDEDNNELTASLSVAAPEVDFAVIELEADPAEPIAGENVTLSATVENQGNVESNETALRFFVNGSALGPDVSVPALAPGENTTLASENWTATEGEHTISAFVDPARETDEPDEADNEREETLTVASDKANLAVDDITLDPEAPEPDEDTTFAANVTNDGNDEAENVTVRFLVDGDELSNATIGALGAGENTSVTSAAWNGSEGEHTVRVEVDTDDNVTESDEDDNHLETTFTVASEDEEEDEADDSDDETDDDADDDADEDAHEDEETITICHIPPGNPDARHTKEIGKPAWEAHEGHGDHKGACEEDAETAEDGDDAEAEEDDEEDGRAAEGNGRGNGRGNGNGHGPP